MKTYYIYHIPGVKIGCTVEPERRVKGNQQYDYYEILETHTCIDTASKREQELQKQYGYRVDTSTYRQSVENMPKDKQSIGGSVSAKLRWERDRERMLKQTLKAGKKGREVQQKKTIMCDLNGNPIKEFNNRREAAKYVNGFPSTIKGAINNPKYTYKGYKWKDG